LAAINKTIHPAELCALVTMTYPAVYPDDPAAWAYDLKLFRQGIEGQFGPVGTIVRKEFGRRGSPHIHLVAALPSGVAACEYTRVARRIWLGIAGDGSSAHERHGADGGPIRSWRAAIAYMSKDGPMPTEEGTGKPRRTGRIWYVWRAELLTTSYRKITLTGRAYVALRRIFRRLARHSSGRSRLVGADRFDAQNVMISEADALRLLEHLGMAVP